MPGALNGQPQGSLVFGANAGPPAGFYLRPVRDETPDAVNVFVIYGFDVVDAERADPPPWREPAPASSTESASGSAPWPASGRWPAAGSSWWRWWCGHAIGDPPISAPNSRLGRPLIPSDQAWLKQAPLKQAWLKMVDRLRRPWAVHPPQGCLRPRQTRTGCHLRPNPGPGPGTGRRKD